MAEIAIIVGSPIRDSFSEALAHAYLHCSQAGGHDATLIVRAHAVRRGSVRRLSVPAAARTRSQESARGVVRLRPAVLIFPLWRGGTPAIL